MLRAVDNPSILVTRGKHPAPFQYCKTTLFLYSGVRTCLRWYGMFIFVHKMYSYIKFLRRASPNSCGKIPNDYDVMNPTNEVRYLRRKY